MRTFSGRRSADAELHQNDIADCRFAGDNWVLLLAGNIDLATAPKIHKQKPNGERRGDGVAAHVARAAGRAGAAHRRAEWPPRKTGLLPHFASCGSILISGARST
jgi:hypothetical protein